jgi:AcrR family transcriptional regulator
MSSPTVDGVTNVVHRPLRADARRNRQRVLEAARATFAEQGRDAQMDDVAGRAQVGVGTVYRHFPTKEALLEALALEAFEKLAAVATGAVGDPTGWGGLQRTLWAGAELLAGDRALSEVLAAIPGPILAGVETERELNTAMTALIERAKAEGGLRADLVLDDIVMLMCGIGAATRKTHACPDAWRRHLAIVIDGIRASGATGALPTTACS